jgi:C4-dicarboxylate transporter DctQ subunit
LILLRILRAIERRFIAICMIAMSAAYFVNVLVRELYPTIAASFAWIEDATLIAFGWLIFVGLGLALERGRHITMTAMSDRLAPSQRYWLRKVLDAIGFLFAGYIAVLGYELTAFVVHSGQVSPTLDISVGFLYAAVPVGFALLALRYLLELIGVTERDSAPADTAH